MIITTSFPGENDRRYGRPWIARVTAWPVGGKAELAWGAFRGTVQAGGTVEIEAAPGDIVRYGQKDNRGNNTVSRWAVVEEDGSLRTCTESEAVIEFRKRPKA